MREFRHVLRRLRSGPAFTIAATLTLAIAIGATASLYSIVDGVLLKAFPYRDADRVFWIARSNPARGMAAVRMTPGDFLEYQAQTTAFSALAASGLGNRTATGIGPPERLQGLVVTPSYFPVLGLTPVLGRGLSPDSGGTAEVVISYGYSRRSGMTVGSTLTLNGSPCVIVGVMPPGLPGDNAIWTQLTVKANDPADRGPNSLDVYGRLAPGVTQQGAQRELETIASRLAAAYPEDDAGFTVVTKALLDTVLGAVRPALLMLLAAAGCVLLIGAANLANLFLVRYLARERELAVRTALGASRGRLVRDLVLEALVLGAAGCAGGVALAFGGARALRVLAPPDLPRLDQVGVDARVVAFCALATLVTMLLFGVLPAWRASRGNVADVVKDGGRGTGTARHHRLQNALVVLQVAVALLLLTGAGLFVKSFERFRHLDLGFQPEGVLTAQLSLPLRSDTGTIATFITTAVDRLAAVPGIRSASVSSNLPGVYQFGLMFSIVGDPPPDPAHKPVVAYMCVTSEYFRTMGIPILRGRGILPTDERHSSEIAVVDRLFSRKYFAGRDPIGQRLVMGPDTVPIVGIVDSVRLHGLAKDEPPAVYFPYVQCGEPFVFAEVRAAGDPGVLAGAMRRAIYSVDPTAAVSDVQTMTTRVNRTVGSTRFSTLLASLFAVVALVLGVVGIYSVLAYVVAQRRREIGIRLALGATHGHVIANVLRHALALTGIGILLGSAAAWWVTRALSGLFLGVSPHDPAAFLGAAGLFTGVALLAASVPAFRTTRVNAAVVLS
ncbi:MAG TPA: ABC transporter permease [Gemmatimonadaceae bacterium]|nr:ABC transporter permease [Gemmatimonadaceae bacterium]